MDQVQQWLFETAWWLVAALAVIALVVTLFALLRKDKALRTAGLVALLVAVGWLLATLLVVTPRERALERTQAIVVAYDAQDWAALRSLIDDQTRFDDWLVGEQIVDAARATRQSLRQQGVSLTDASATQDAAGVRVDIEVVSEQDEIIDRLRTAWRFEYVERGNQWVLDRILPLPTDHLNPEDIRRRVRTNVPGR